MASKSSPRSAPVLATAPSFTKTMDEAIPCTGCSEHITHDDLFCRKCGAPTPQRCTACGSRGGLLRGDHFCGKCGAPPPPSYTGGAPPPYAPHPPPSPCALVRHPSDIEVLAAIPVANVASQQQVSIVNTMGGAGSPAQRASDPERLVLHAARYGWAQDLWGARLGSGNNHGGGAKDVTDIVRGLIANNELDINPRKEPQYMNRTFWRETARGPAIPRKLAVRYSYGVDGPVLTVQTKPVPHETERLIVRRGGAAPAAAGGAPTAVRNAVRPPDQISAEALEGCWGCVCCVAFCALERKRAEGPDAIVHEGFCFPALACYSEAWDRVGDTNTFKKRGEKDILTYGSAGGCLCFGPGCTVKLCKCNTLPAGRDPKRRIPAGEIAGCWGCVAARCGCWAIERKVADGEDTLVHTGLCFPLLLPFSEPWDREGSSNVFVKRGKGDRLEYHSPGGPLFGRDFCSCRLCKC